MKIKRLDVLAGPINPNYPSLVNNQLFTIKPLLYQVTGTQRKVRVCLFTCTATHAVLLGVKRRH